MGTFARPREITDLTTTNMGGATWIEPVHDDAGNMTEMPSPLAPTSSLLATYDAWNRMVIVANSGGTILTNEYDGNHHRIRKVVNGGDTFDYYYNDRWQLIAEAKNGSADSLYAWHANYIDALAVRFRAADKHAFMHDANFNVTAAYDVTPGSGAYRTVVERYRYTPYGEVTFLDGSFGAAGSTSAIGNNYLYTGRERDSETGLQLNRMRWYHALLGRWVTWDPIRYRGGLNLYRYVRSAPTFGRDPMGLSPYPCKEREGGCCEPPRKGWGENAYCKKVTGFAHAPGGANPGPIEDLQTAIDHLQIIQGISGIAQVEIVAGLEQSLQSVLETVLDQQAENALDLTDNVQEAVNELIDLVENRRGFGMAVYVEWYACVPAPWYSTCCNRFERRTGIYVCKPKADGGISRPNVWWGENGGQPTVADL